MYQQYDPKQPWDSPQNRALGNTPLAIFRCPSDPGTTANPAETNYVRVVGKDTVGGTPNEAVKISDITDGTSNTIMVVEVSGLNINWEEPRDVTVDEFMDMVAKGRASRHSGGFQAAMADGSVHFISNSIDPKTLRALLIAQRRPARRRVLGLCRGRRKMVGWVEAASPASRNSETVATKSGSEPSQRGNESRKPERHRKPEREGSR